MCTSKNAGPSVTAPKSRTCSPVGISLVSRLSMVTIRPSSTTTIGWWMARLSSHNLSATNTVCMRTIIAAQSRLDAQLNRGLSITFSHTFVTRDWFHLIGCWHEYEGGHIDCPVGGSAWRKYDLR